MKKNSDKPLILAPVGTRASFLAAIVAGADAIYCGLKKFSARMEAKNFDTDELAQLTALAKKKGVKVFVAMNVMLKPDELQEAGKTIDIICRYVKPDGIIVQDLAFIALIRQVKFKGQIHLSTLANVSFPKALHFIKQALNILHVVIPRELNIDEIKSMAEACPENFKLETFVHGALCYGISGRCYWSSYMGGKSSLRGRCVQPCRRLYSQKDILGRTFSCCDLSLDVLTKVINHIPEINLWKIEGRKKSPHYVFYTVSAYKILRDYGKDAKKKKVAIALLDNCLGRQSSHYNFLPQRPQNPIKLERHTASGLLIGRIKGGKKPFINPRQKLFPDDVLRIGYEGELSHCVIRITRYVPKKGKLFIKSRYGQSILTGTPVFLKDRREKHLKEMILKMENSDDLPVLKKYSTSKFLYSSIKSKKYEQKILNVRVNRKLNIPVGKDVVGVWLSEVLLKYIKNYKFNLLWVWLPPVIWPEFESNFYKLINKILALGVRNFVLNTPWQMAFFKNYNFLNIWAGPFCNISNAISLEVLRNIGFKGAVVSPELHLHDYIKLADESPIPLGVVISGNWPLCISRFISDKFALDCFFKSPKGEGGWVTQHDSDYWVFPNWQLDITKKRNIFLKAGYKMFVTLIERVPNKIALKKRPGLWNLKIGLK